MKTTSEKTTKTYTFVKQGGRWYPMIGRSTIDQRGDGHASKSAVRRWAQDRELYCGEIVTVKFA